MNLLRTDYGDGASHPSGMSVLGADEYGTVWADRDGYRVGIPAPTLAVMRRAIVSEFNTGDVYAEGHWWDESQVNSLVAALDWPHTLTTCRDCQVRPVVERVDDRCDECGDADEARSDEIGYTRRLG